MSGEDLVKYFKSVSTQLDMQQYDKLMKICDKEGCKPYGVLKDLLTDYIESYPKEGEKHEREETKREDIRGAGESSEDID